MDEVISVVRMSDIDEVLHAFRMEGLITRGMEQRLWNAVDGLTYRVDGDAFVTSRESMAEAVVRTTSDIRS